jgi:hypothetical protein
MSNPQGADWESYWTRLQFVRSSVNKSRAVDLNSEVVRSEVRGLVQDYFRSVRPALAQMGLTDPLLAGLDEPAQELLRLANGRNRRLSYQRAISKLRKARAAVELERERRLGHAAVVPAIQVATSGVEAQLLTSLRKLLPSAALSYEQALRDLRGPARLSYRGTTAELREALREVLDHLAPDTEVMQSVGFKLDKDATRPTMKQKAQFILKARGLASGALSTPRDAIQRIEDSAASLTRSVYSRGSVSTHVVTTRQEVLTMKPYVDSVLAELLQVQEAV